MTFGEENAIPYTWYLPTLALIFYFLHNCRIPRAVRGCKFGVENAARDVANSAITTEAAALSRILCFGPEPR